MKICSNCAFKVLDNQKFCPKCGLPVDSKMLENTSKEIISDSKKQKSEKQESEKQSNLNIPDNKKKKHINKSIIMITIIAITIIVLGGFIVKSIILNQDNSHDEVEPNVISSSSISISNENTEEDEYSKLKDIITYVKNEFANIMKSENIVFIKFDESNNRYLFETVYESSQEQYYYYPETDEITINIPGAEAIINQDFSFKTTFWGEPSDEDYDWQIYLRRRTSYEEVVKVNESMDNIAKNMFSDMLDYAISPNVECEIEGIDLYLVRVNKGEPDYEVNEFLLGSNGITYDYWEAISGNRLIEIF